MKSARIFAFRERIDDFVSGKISWVDDPYNGWLSDHRPLHRWTMTKSVRKTWSWTINRVRRKWEWVTKSEMEVYSGREETKWVTKRRTAKFAVCSIMTTMNRRHEIVRMQASRINLPNEKRTEAKMRKINISDDANETNFDDAKGKKWKRYSNVATIFLEEIS